MRRRCISLRASSCWTDGLVMASTNNNDENDEPVMTRENDEEPKAPSLFSSLQKICSDSFTRLDRYQLECLGRTGVTALVGVSLAVANIPSAVPSSTAYFIPVFGVFFGTYARHTDTLSRPHPLILGPRTSQYLSPML